MRLGLSSAQGRAAKPLGRSFAGLALVLPGMATQAAARHGHQRPLVFVNSDSLAVGTEPYLPGDLHGFNLRQSASISRHAPRASSCCATWASSRAWS